MRRARQVLSALRVLRLRFVGGIDIWLDSRVDERVSITKAKDARIAIRGCHLARGVVIDASSGATIEVAADFIGAYSVVAARERVTIGPETQLGEFVIVRDHDHEHGPDVSLSAWRFISRPVQIGRNVWIGASALVLSGVTIGDHVLVAGGAVVTRDVPEAERVGGVPAKPLRRS